jgi:hypothetical protein
MCMTQTQKTNYRAFCWMLAKILQRYASFIYIYKNKFNTKLDDLNSTTSYMF